jgi:hypothetical protein
MNFIIGLLAIYLFGALWYIAFQDDPMLVGISTSIAILIAGILEWRE